MIRIAALFLLVLAPNVIPEYVGPPKTIDETILKTALKDETAGVRRTFTDDVTIIEGDIVVTKEQYNESLSGISQHKGLRNEYYRWTDKTIPYYINNHFTSSEKQAIMRGIAEWEKYTCIRFTPWNNHRNYVNVVDGGGCSSWVGMIRGRQDLTLSRRGCIWHHTIVHEFGHAVGFHHEQKRPDRDEFITVHLDNVSAGMRFNYKKNTWSEINDQGVPYDYRSVMHYGQYAFSMNRRRTMTTKNAYYQNIIGTAPGLSYSDIKMANRMYKCASHCNIECPKGAIVNKDCKCWCATNNPKYPVEECDGTVGSGGGGEGSGDPGGECTNDHERCQEWADRGECTNNPNYMLWNCAKSCKICGDDAGCDNYNSQCEQWALEGYCIDPDYQEYMKRFCRPACRVCEGDDGGDGGEDPNCQNHHSRCDEWANRGECRINPNYMLWNCPKSCKLCGKDAGCEDYDDDCPRWSTEGYCKDPDYVEFMKRFCRKSCSLC